MSQEVKFAPVFKEGDKYYFIEMIKFGPFDTNTEANDKRQYEINYEFGEINAN